jgi:hypothetical protein
MKIRMIVVRKEKSYGFKKNLGRVSLCKGVFVRSRGKLWYLKASRNRSPMGNIGARCVL